MTPYASIKAALDHFTRCLALGELGAVYTFDMCIL